ncbi:hypothetical protein V495_04220, partial [Pseudogymnoascus sp. VKM F-4514 (FW-929)]
MNRPINHREPEHNFERQKRQDAQEHEAHLPQALDAGIAPRAIHVVPLSLSPARRRSRPLRRALIITGALVILRSRRCWSIWWLSEMEVLTAAAAWESAAREPTTSPSAAAEAAASTSVHHLEEDLWVKFEHKTP